MFLETAHQIGIRIARTALWNGNACSWTVTIAPHPQRGGPASVRPAGPTLYTGTAGIALFLAELFRLTGDAEAGRAAGGALRHAMTEGERMPENAFAFHQGRVGIAFAALRTADALGDQGCADAAARLLAPLAGSEAEDRALDVMGGAAGAIPVLLGMAARPGLQAVREVAVRLGEHLLRVAEREPGGWSWRSAGPVHIRNLSGLGHGAAGMGHALLELYQATGDGRFLYGGEQAFAYERQFFDPARENWPDLRHPELAQYHFSGRMGELRALLTAGGSLAPRRPGGMLAWCYGAPGIGLTRLRAYQALGRPLYRAEAEAAVRTTAAWLAEGHVPRTAAHASLCHGAAGNSETLWLAAQVLGQPALREQARERAWAAWETFDRAAAPDMPREAGLMLGEAGIGHAFLRLQGADVPSVLLPTAPVPPRAPSAEAASEAEPLRRRDADAWFGRAVRVWECIRGRTWEPAADAGEPEAAAAYLRLRADAEAEPDPAVREQLADALRPEEARWHVALGINDHAARFMDGLRRPPAAEVAWDTARFRAAPHARRIRCAWDWDGWLGRPPGAEPERRATDFAVYEAGTRARLQPLASLAALLLDALAAPRSLADLAVLVAAETGTGVDTVAASVRAQLQELYAGGIVDPA